MSQSRKNIRKLQKQRQQKRKETAKKHERAVQQRPGQTHDDVIDDMLPLFPKIGGPSAVSDAGLNEFMLTILDTGDLADEPELAGILFDPMLVTETFGNIAKKVGFSPEKANSLSQKEQDDIHFEILEKCVKQIFTPEIRRDILKRLDDLRLRLKRSGKKKKTARVAALISFLREDKKSESWPMIGLSQALVQRHVNIGFDLMDLAITAGPDVVDGASWSETGISKKPGVIKKLKTLLKTPGLSDYLEQKAEKTWKEGVDSVFSGKLNLHVYTEDEIETSYEMLVKMRGFDSTEAMEAAGKSQKLSDENAKEFISQLATYIKKIVTSARLKQLRVRIDILLKDPQYQEKWAPFLAMLMGHLEEKKVVEYEMRFFIAALFGELRIAAKEESERQGQAESDEETPDPKE